MEINRCTEEIGRQEERQGACSEIERHKKKRAWIAQSEGAWVAWSEIGDIEGDWICTQRWHGKKLKGKLEMGGRVINSCTMEMGGT